MLRKVMAAVVAVAVVLVVTMILDDADAAASTTALLVPASLAFSFLGRSCGGIQEQALATGFDATSGYPTGDVYLQTRCGGSGRGGGYHTTTYSAWVGVTWDYTGAVVAADVLGAAPTDVSPTFSAVDAFGNEVYNQLNAVNVLPAGCTVGNTTYCSYRAYLSLDLNFVAPPRVTGVSVTSGPASGGTTVTVTGTGFSGATAVTFGATPAASFTVNDDASIAALSPAEGAGTVDVTVTTAGGTSAASASDLFTFIGAPTLTSINPSTGPITGGTEVTITGASLTDAIAVNFGENPAGFTVNDDSSITALSPAAEAAESVHVKVTTLGGTTSTSPADRFTYTAIPTPTVSGVSPNGGPIDGGTTVIITGANFTYAFEVDFGATPVDFTINDDASITAVSPAAVTPGTVDVAVTSAGGTSAPSAADQFTYAATTSVQCAKLSGTLAGTLRISRCTPKSPATRSAALDPLTSTFTWKRSGETTIVSLGASSPGQGACSAGSVEYDIAGTVVGGTSAYAAVGNTISAQACVKPNGRLSLVKGTTFGL